MYSKENKPTIGTLLKTNRLIAKTVNRIIVEPNHVSLTDWATEAKLFISKEGNCLSSTTLLVYQKYVPTYAYDGRRYGVLINAQEAYVYDVNSKDANTNRTDKLKKREARKNINLLSPNQETSRLNLKTLDDLAKETKEKQAGAEINEVLLDATKDSLVGLFVRGVELAPKTNLKDYYLSLLEILLIQKYLHQAFDLPLLKICIYYEREGILGNFPNQEELFIQARTHGVNFQTYPALFERLANNYVFSKFKPVTLNDFLARYQQQEVLGRVRDQVIMSLISSYKPFVPRQMDEKTILGELVDLAVGLNPDTIQDTINSCIESINSSHRKLISKNNKSIDFFSNSLEPVSPDSKQEDDMTPTAN